MFRTIDRLRQRLNGDVGFTTSAPAIRTAFEEFAAIEDITVRHGFKDAAGMAATLASAHAGILTSEFEGMPRFVLETLAVGRPVVAMHLPQLEPVIRAWRQRLSGGAGRQSPTTWRMRSSSGSSMSGRHRCGRDGSRADRRQHQVVHARAPSWRGCSAIIRKFRMRVDLPPRHRPIEGAALNILLLTSEFAPAMGGIGTYAREIASAATALGAKVTVVAPDYARQTDDDDRSLPFEVLRFRGGLHSMRDLPPRSCWRAAASAAIDTMWSMPPIGRSSFRVALSRWRTPARVLMTVHGTEINETQTPLKRLAIRGAGVFGPRTRDRRQQPLYRDAVPRAICRRPRQDQRDQSRRIGFLVRRATDNAARFAWRYRLAQDRLVMVTVARITRRKGHHLTLAALSQLPDESAPAHHLARDRTGRRSRLCRRTATGCRSAACDIRLLGPQPNEAIRDLYAASDFFCLTGLPDTTGRVEGFGLVYLEAGAAGLPSVATEVGGVPDAVLADETGILVPPSVESISQAIAELAADRGLRAILAAGASAHARALSWERCAATTYGLAYAGNRTSAARACGTVA